MTLSQTHRSSIFTTLSPIIGREEAEALLSEFPTTPDDELVTRSVLRTELTVLRSDLRSEIADLRSDLRSEIADLRSDLRSEIADLRSEMHKLFTRGLVWGTGALLGGLSTGMTLAALIARG